MSDVKEKGNNMQHVLLMCHRFVSILVPTDRSERLIHLFVCYCKCVFFNLEVSTVLKGCDGVDSAGGAVLI